MTERCDGEGSFQTGCFRTGYGAPFLPRAGGTIGTCVRVWRVRFRRLTLRSATGTAQRAIPTKDGQNINSKNSFCITRKKTGFWKITEGAWLLGGMGVLTRFLGN